MSWPKRKRTYNVDDDFFDVIDTESKAYILGLICSDGYLIKNGNTRGLGFEFNFKDKSLLEMISEQMKFEGWIRDATHGMKRITMTSSKLYNRLVEIGISSTKSYDLGPLNIQLPSHLNNHLFRGCVDGDGCFTFEKNTTYGNNPKGNKRYISYRNRFSIRGTENFLNYLSSLCPIKLLKTFNVTPVLYLTKRDTVLEFRKWLYKDATIYLRRKFDVIPNSECAVLGNKYVQILSN